MQTLPTLAVPADCEWARPWFPVDPMDLLHQPSAAHTQWTTVNLGEVFPGVPTPLNWAVLGAAGERGLRDALHAIGCYKASETQIPADPSQRTIGIMWGRAVANLDAFRNFADRMPGSSGDAMETQIFGSSASINSSKAVYTRYPVVLAKMPFAAIQRRRQLVQLSETTEQWWHEAVFPSQPRDRLAATALLWEAHRRIAKIFDPHNVMMMVALGVFTQVRSLVASVGLSEIETKLMYTGDTAESQTVADLWRLSREQLSMQTFLSHHGFHGPRENEVSGYVWREDQTPLLNLVTRYRDMGEDASPLKAADERLLARADAERQLMAQLSPLQRVRARLLLKLARYYVPTREMGRDAFLKGMDVVRYAARVIGADLVAHGLLDQVDDTFYLTPFELTELPDGLRERVALRRQKRAHYETLDLPERWTGLVEPQAKSKPADNVKVAGLGVSAGVVEGRVRVVLDPAADELEPDELLVCRTTDPGWASYFFIAAGVIIDIGGPLSHGAIIARELGLPCVINAKNATEQLRTGDLVRMDGTTGQVDVLERAPQGDTA